MKKLYASNESAEVELVENMVEQDGFPCTIQTATGLVPFTDCFPELWVINDEDYPKAKQLVDNWLSSKTEASASWKCPECGEFIEPQFTACWKCSKEKEAETETDALKDPSAG